MAVILVVDDDPLMRRILDISLGYAGHTILEAGNGEEALSLLETTRPQLLMVDVMMPVMNGIQLAEALHTSPTLHDIPVVMMSAGANQELLHDVPATAFLSKPFGIDELNRMVNQVLAVT